MPRYLIERELGDITDDALEAAGEESTRVREEGFPEIVWEHSHVVRTADGLRSYCVYAAPDVQSIRAHAERAGLPVDRVHEIHVDLRP